jgi:uncharacterized protein
VAVLEDELHSSLDPGERLLWSGRPVQGVVFTPRDWYLIPTPAREPAFSAPAPGGFLASALSTAASVAGGMLLADSIRGLFGGHYGSAELGSPHVDQATLDRAQDEAQDARDDADESRQDLAADDAALDDMQDAQDDTGGDWGGGDMDT